MRGKFFWATLFCSLLLSFWTTAWSQERIIIETPFEPTKMDHIDYPEVLRREGIAARVQVILSINRKGDVIRASATYVGYPELSGERFEDKIKKWKFRPFIHKGEAISVFGAITLVFWPGERGILDVNRDSSQVSLEGAATANMDSKLRDIINKCTDYAERLSNAALFYVCREEIEERDRELKPSEIVTTAAGSADLGPGETLSYDNKWLVLEGGEKYHCVQGYQLVRKGGSIREIHFPIAAAEKGLTNTIDWQGVAGGHSLRPILLPFQIFGEYSRNHFSFKLAGEEIMQGKPVYILKANPIAGEGWFVRGATIWVEKSSCRIAKWEQESDCLEGYDEILAECRREHFKPHFIVTCYYEIDKNGLLYPSRSESRVEYSGLLFRKKDLKSEVKNTYDQYKFFTVETDQEIIKKEKPAHAFNPKKSVPTDLMPCSSCDIIHF